VKGRPAESATFPNRKEAEASAASLETVLPDFDEVQRAARAALQLNWWSRQFAGKSIAEITADAISKARDACAAETFTRGKPTEDKKTGERRGHQSNTGAAARPSTATSQCSRTCCPSRLRNAARSTATR